MFVIFSYASCRRLANLLSASINHKRLIHGLWHKRRDTWMVIAMACCMVHRLLVPVSLRTMAFRRLLYLRESYHFLLGR